MMNDRYIDLKRCKEDFPIFESHPKLTYLDNAASTQTPIQVIDKMTSYYRSYRSNVHRSFYEIANKATEEYENVRNIVASYIGGESDSVIFTKNSTEALNTVAYSLVVSGKIRKGSLVCLSEIEHHSNIVEWMILAKYVGFEIAYIELLKDSYDIDYMSLDKICRTREISVLSLTHQSNVTGLTTSVEKIKDILKKNKQNPITIIDASQSAAHGNADVKELDVDAVAFTGHKLLGPTGTGALWIKPELLKELSPVFGGGEMVDHVTKDSFVQSEIPYNFEAGTQNISGILGLGEAVKYMLRLDKELVGDYENALKNRLLDGLSRIKQVKTIVPLDLLYSRNLTQITFYTDNVHAHDIAQFLGEREICVRAGYHCSSIVFNTYNIPPSVRASLIFYNSYDDVDRFLDTLKESLSFF